MKIKKPNSIILFKKYPDRYFDWYTDKEFIHNQINEHPRWYKKEYDNNGNVIYCEHSDGYWIKREYDNNGKLVYREDSDGWWGKYEYNNNGNQIYYENSDGVVINNTI